MDRRPNVLLICTDQHRYDVLSCYGNPAALTPNIAGLADQGVVFDHCYSTSTVCAPARASMMTGKYPHSHRLWANGVTLPADEVPVSRRLSDAGYRCGLIGKVHLSACFQGRTERGLDHGFEVLEWAHDPHHGSPENAYHAWLREHFPDFWERARDEAITPTSAYQHESTLFDRAPTEAHYSTWVTERALSFLDDQRSDRPFFCWVNYYDPHHAFVAPEEYLDRYPAGSVPAPVGGPDELAAKPAMQSVASRESYAGHARGFATYTTEEIDEVRRSYYAMVSLVDDKVGELLRGLEARGLADDTLVIFVGDHGEMLGDHALLLKGPMMYDPAVRVPLVLRWPGRVPAGVRRSGMTGLHDLAPTLLAAAGLESPPDMQGDDLLPVATGSASGRGWAMAEYRDAGHPYDPPVHTTMYRTHDHKLVVWHGGPATDRAPDGELYDLREDPDELVNRWEDPAYQQVKVELLAALLAARVATEDRTPPREAAW